MSNLINKSIGDYYNNLVEKFGDDPRSADYGHANSQAIKFNVLSEATNYTKKSILDIGCGFADYYDFLQTKYKDIEYHGVDLSLKMIETAKIKHPELTLELKNVFENPLTRKYDIVTANGIFYLLGKDSKILMHEYISKMFEMANDVVVFNTLSSWATDQEQNEFYADPSETLNFCQKLSPWVTIRLDYHPRDFTIYLYKNRNI